MFIVCRRADLRYVEDENNKVIYGMFIEIDDGIICADCRCLNFDFKVAQMEFSLATLICL